MNNSRINLVFKKFAYANMYVLNAVTHCRLGSWKDMSPYALGRSNRRITGGHEIR